MGSKKDATENLGSSQGSSDGESSHDLSIKDWKGREVLIWQNSEGEVGILDAVGYSIIIDPECAADVMGWLAAFVERRNRSTDGCSLRELVVARLGGVGAMSGERFGECLWSIARDCNRTVDTEFRSEVNEILRNLECPLD